MFVRVRDFGARHQALFSETSSGVATVARLTAAMEALDDQLMKRVVARAEARKVKKTTRRALTDYMKALAFTGRRVAVSEPGMNPFRMPRRQSAGALLSAARVLMQEAEKREAEFVRLGLPPAFLSEFQAVLNDMDTAVSVQINSRTARQRAQAGFEGALVDGLDAIRTLDVIVRNQLRADPVLLAAWGAARQIEGMKRGSRGASPAPPPIPPAAIIEPSPASTAPLAVESGTGGSV
jgi:hypothetical protein